MSTGPPSPRRRSPSLLSRSDSAYDSQPIEDDGDIPEEQLRELFDNEEIERFLTLFSAYVTEVRAPGQPSNETSLRTSTLSPSIDANGPTPLTDDSTPSNVCDTPHFPNLSFLEGVVAQWLIPVIPPSRLPPPAFTVGRFRLTIQRLYLAVGPVYISFFSRMVELATWKERKISLFYCVAFWMLWYHDVLLPCFLLRIFYSLVRRKIFPYPTLTELRYHRREISRATQFGNQISDELSASSSFGVKEIWRLLKIFIQATKHEVRLSSKATENSPAVQDSGVPARPEEVTLVNDLTNSQETRDMKRLCLEVLNEIADIHERIRNIFIWRRPASSYVYGVALFCLFFVTLLLPAKYLTKLTYFVGGILFWHVTPIIAALPSAERSRLPPAFGDVPTDADYAIELIAKRVAAGLDVSPLRARKHGKRHKWGQTVERHQSAPQRNNDEQPERNSQSVDWKKWAERAAIGKTWAYDSRRSISGRMSDALAPPRSLLAPPYDVDIAKPEQSGDSHTYPAQHSSGPGLVTLTDSTLLFTPLMSLDPKFIIPLKRIYSVKKAGVLNGLHMHAALGDGPETGEREEKFRWIGGRDEIFARLVGTEGRRWMKA